MGQTYWKKMSIERAQDKGPKLHCGAREAVLEEKEFKVSSEVHEGINRVEGREWGTFTKVIG